MSSRPLLPGDDAVSVEETRRAISEFLSQRKTADVRGARSRPNENSDEATLNGAKRDSDADFEWSALLSSAASAWWDEHPMRAGASVLRLATEEFARRKPLTTVGVAALLGAGFVAMRPWRMVSARALAMRLVQGSNLAIVAASTLASAALVKKRRL